LSAELLPGGVAKPSLAGTYKSKVNDAFAQLDQKSLSQLILIEFLACPELRKNASPETLAAMDRALQRAIANATKAQSVGGKLSPGSKQAIEATPYGPQKLAGLEKLGL